MLCTLWAQCACAVMWGAVCCVPASAPVSRVAWALRICDLHHALCACVACPCAALLVLLELEQSRRSPRYCLGTAPPPGASLSGARSEASEWSQSQSARSRYRYQGAGRGSRGGDPHPTKKGPASRSADSVLLV